MVNLVGLPVTTIVHYLHVCICLVKLKQVITNNGIARILMIPGHSMVHWVCESFSAQNTEVSRGGWRHAPREFWILKPLRSVLKLFFGHHQQHLSLVVIMYVCMQYPSTKDGKLGTQTATLSVRCGHAPWSEAVLNLKSLPYLPGTSLVSTYQCIISHLSCYCTPEQRSKQVLLIVWSLYVLALLMLSIHLQSVWMCMSQSSNLISVYSYTFTY